MHVGVESVPFNGVILMSDENYMYMYTSQIKIGWLTLSYEYLPDIS